MGATSLLVWSFALISFATSVANLSIMFYIISKLKRDLIDRASEVNEGRHALLIQQGLMLRADAETSSERIDNIERILSAVLSGGSGAGFDDTMH